ncbi:hypothetical protein P4525_13725 [Peribacillus psychrosaccharolyticus]|uniref:hypothetical protein n=1 Tax=Peribacillus psychrosaccharolyticus TaxID=1407 RepID=UPI002E21AC37|nr:hypothetical protein [Peribacillus psychrosaccharolyticus]
MSSLNLWEAFFHFLGDVEIYIVRDLIVSMTQTVHDCSSEKTALVRSEVCVFRNE